MDATVAMDVQVSCAVIQVLAAMVALAAAFKIARDERLRAERIERARTIDFVLVVDALLDELEICAADAIAKLRSATADPTAVKLDWVERASEVGETLAAIRSPGPPDAVLALSLTRILRIVQRVSRLPITEPNGMVEHAERMRASLRQERTAMRSRLPARSVQSL